MLLVESNQVPEQEKKYGIKYWAEDDRPREKLLLKGNNALSDAELVAILIGSGSRNESAVELAKKILASVDNNLNELSKLSVHNLCQFKGIGEAKAISIITALELGKRRGGQVAAKKIQLTNSQDAFQLMRPFLSDLTIEEFWVVYLNQNNKVLHKEQISTGGITHTIVDKRVILKKALELSATALMLFHNHPSGNFTPSREDRELTQALKNAVNLLDIHLLDHLIITQNDYFSFDDEGLL